jgi:hypothetical protein
MSPSKSKCWYSNNCLHLLKCAVPLWHPTWCLCFKQYSGKRNGYSQVFLRTSYYCYIGYCGSSVKKLVLFKLAFLNWICKLVLIIVNTALIVTITSYSLFSLQENDLTHRIDTKKYLLFWLNLVVETKSLFVEWHFDEWSWIRRRNFVQTGFILFCLRSIDSSCSTFISEFIGEAQLKQSLLTPTTHRKLKQ